MATYRGRTVPLNKPMRGDVKKFKVFVKDGNKVKKINFGDPNMTIKKITQLEKNHIVLDLQALKVQTTNYLRTIGVVECGIVNWLSP